MPDFCKVALPLPLPKTFDYRVPAGMPAAPGCRVKVPWGRRSLTGVVTELSDRSEVEEPRPLEALLDPRPVVPAAMLEFTRWVAQYYLAGWGEVLPLACPPLWKGRAETWARAADAEALRAFALGLPARQEKSRGALLRLAGSGSLPLAELKSLGLSAPAWRRVQELGWASRQERAAPPPETEAEASGAVELGEARPDLTPAQAGALEEVRGALKAGDAAAFLLHGVTGSGKTEVYLRALEEALDLGGGAIVLVPEISLTPQTLGRFSRRFPGRVAVLHSGLSARERAASFSALASGRARVALGPRSALFTPVRNLKLLVVDEESEPSYKQESAPRYHARDAALVRARREGAVALLGSATPSFESFQNCRLGKLKLLRMPDRVAGRALPRFHFIDLAGPAGEEGSQAGFLSRPLKEAVSARLEAGEQSLLFLNRRGFAPVLSCARCGQALQCPHCSISLTYHLQKPFGFSGPGESPGGAGQGPWMLCHLCGHARRPPRFCPEPGCAPSKGLMRVSGAGTQRLEEELRRLFPSARLLRVDRDTAGEKAFHEKVGRMMRSGEVDILVGTQMIAKGLDFPNLTLVGVVNADAGLQFPDFRAAERSFQLLVQVAGRGGRGEKPGEVWVQSRMPQHPCLQAASRQDFEEFFRAEVAERRDLGYPPFGRLAALILRSRDKDKALDQALRLARLLESARARLGLKGISVLGPAPSPLVRVQGWWRYRLLVKSGDSGALHRLLDPLAFEFKPSGGYLAVDVDPISFL